MKNKMPLIAFFIISCTIAQNTNGLWPHKNFQIHGGLVAIGNTIVGVDSKNAYRKRGNEVKKNDELSIRYVDIDNDHTTFSSSSADLLLPVKEISYAALYWTATYPYEKGSVKGKRKRHRYNIEVDRVSDFNTIQFTLPNHTTHILQGVVLSDFKNDIGGPYVCYADVTELIKESEKKVGTYMVANIRASQGRILGGSSGGWMLAIVYKDDQEPIKDISLLHGLHPLDKLSSPTTIPFELNLNGSIKHAKLITAVLEGDEGLKTDRLALVTEGVRFPLHSGLRPKNNYYNSTISEFGQITSKRNPNSTNTLGFDLATVDLENELGASETAYTNNSFQIEFESKRDLFFLFFVGLDVVIPSGKANGIAENKTAPITETTTNQGYASDYYLVTNVFSEHHYALAWKKHLVELGYTPGTLIHPKNNWEYIYIASSTDRFVFEELRQKLKVEKEFKDIWVLEMPKGNYQP
ncbi:hypothetical protein V1387_17890 [Allomuricauda taeanensis]|uniref:hypothetical protein n=1 Tax=Flagellimonas taeanensis TaxID=1005926 RepID=UPI002E7BE646|nr:hypothetical protein [Allomuricauda taeanensis]MEE1964565.1 hypothetical protein [Allomuricauda taeanensis]